MQTQWFCKVGGRVLGPLSSAELLKKVRSGEVHSATPVRKNDSQWFPAEEVNGLFESAFKDQPGRFQRDVDTEYHGDS